MGTSHPWLSGTLGQQHRCLGTDFPEPCHPAGATPRGSRLGAGLCGVPEEGPGPLGSRRWSRGPPPHLAPPGAWGSSPWAYTHGPAGEALPGHRRGRAVGEVAPLPEHHRVSCLRAVLASPRARGCPHQRGGCLACRLREQWGCGGPGMSRPRPPPPTVGSQGRPHPGRHHISFRLAEALRFKNHQGFLLLIEDVHYSQRPLIMRKKELPFVCIWDLECHTM